MFLGILFVNILLLLGDLCDGSKSTKYCLVCRVLVSEAEWSISQVDPKKSIQVGSFRVDPKGNQNMKDKQYARSEGHIEDIMESVCDKLKQYAEIKFDDGTIQMVRTVGFNGKRLEAKGFQLDRDKGKAFKYQCENFLEDHEEEIISLLQLENTPDIEKLVCGEKLEVCSLDELWTPLFTLPEAQDEEEITNEEDDIVNLDAENVDNVEKDSDIDGASPPPENVDVKIEL